MPLFFAFINQFSSNFVQKFKSGSSGLGLKIGKFYQCIQSYGPSFMTKFCSALLYLENLLTNIFAKTEFAWRGIMHACSAFI